MLRPLAEPGVVHAGRAGPVARGVPGGVCDYTRPGVGQVSPVVTWQSYPDFHPAQRPAAGD